MKVEIQWFIDDYILGIKSGTNKHLVIDHDLVDSFEDLVEQVSLALKREYYGMSFAYDEEWGFVDSENLKSTWRC